MKALIVSLVMICLAACTVKEVKIEEVETNPADNATELIVSTWTQEKKEYWTSMTFAQLSVMPQVRVRFSPWHLFKLSKCII